ncbi:MAG: hypothetical protein Q8L56_03110 [Rhodocyclaceae bacterium]|nr:hypothetical protein [Rhodocyclaceae bacterium]
MKRTPLDALITLHALTFIRPRGDFLDLIPDEELEGKYEIKNVCAKVSAKLSDEIDSICGLLNIRKRQFLECAFIEAIEKANSIIEAEGVEDLLGKLSEEQAAAREAKK